MTTSRLQELIGVASAPLASSKPNKVNSNFTELVSILSQKNGFYAFESALHVFPSNGRNSISVEDWNSEGLWKSEYGDLANGLFFFAEDVFGGQFAIGEDGVYSFDTETAKRQKLSRDLEGWADCILTDYNYLTGYPIACEWQEKNGPLRQDCRLLAKIPFVCGGSYTIDNLAMVGAIEGMKWHGDLARQIKDISDGGQIVLKTINKPPPPPS